MSDYLVLKKASATVTGQASDWSPVTIARGIEGDNPDDRKATAIKEGYTGEGTYKALEWDDDIEADVGPPLPPEVKMVRRAIVEAEAEDVTQ